VLEKAVQGYDASAGRPWCTEVFIGAAGGRRSPRLPGSLACGLVEDNAMLEDVDRLAARIGELVQFSKQLQSERAALQARIAGLEQERTALRDQIKRKEAEFTELSENTASHQARIDILRAETDSIRVALQAEVDRYKAECETLHRQ